MKKKVIQWVIAAFIALMALSAFATKGGIISGFLYLLLAVVISPLRENVVQLLPEQFRKKWITIVAGVLLLFIGALAYPTTENAKVADANLIEAEVTKSIPENELEEKKEEIEEKEEKAEVNKEEIEEKEDEVEEENQLEKVDKNNNTMTTAASELPATDENNPDSSTEEKTDDNQKEEQSGEAPQQEQEEVVTEKDEGLNGEQTTPSEDVGDESKSVDNTQNESSQGDNGNGDNFNKYDIPEQQNTEDTYVLNTNTMKFHYPSCKSVKKIKPENYATSSASRDELMLQGYSPCGNCDP